MWQLSKIVTLVRRVRSRCLQRGCMPASQSILSVFRLPEAGVSILPSRVLDVGPSDGSSEPFLYESHEHQDKYITLSYKWGNETAMSVKTVMHNLESHKQSISLKTFPQTIRDAIFITSKLGIRFLWVDSLCIVQDSDDDWYS